MSSTVPTHMQNNFVKLYEIAPSIIQNLRYASAENFLGRLVTGYHPTGIVCTRQAAIAIKAANSDLNQAGYKLVVYDAYRPQRAVDEFIAWSKKNDDQAGKLHYYPTIPKSTLFSLGYLAEKSGHSRGSTVDLTLIPKQLTLKPIQYRSRTLSNGDIIPFLDDDTIDMGTSFDLLHPASNPDSPLVTAQQAHMRQLLKNTMLRHGFRQSTKEWWHFTLNHEPFPDTYFDFDYPLGQ